jgi:hypothetical protein
MNGIRTQVLRALAATSVAIGLVALPTSFASAAPPSLYDLDGNGATDQHAGDVTGSDGKPDGYLDQNVLTVGGKLVWLLDGDQDTVWDGLSTDNNNDGRPDLWAEDKDENGVVEEWVYDETVFPVAPRFDENSTLVIRVNEGVGFDVDAAVARTEPAGDTTTDPCMLLSAAPFAESSLGCSYRAAA